MTNERTILEPASLAYEPPRVEAVMGPEEVERQVHYAGEASPVEK
jgi:hypothetical protein